ASSAVKSDSRYSGTLELHDFDFDGISDHDNSNNALEGGLDSAAIGRKGSRGAPRSEDLDQSRTEAGLCSPTTPSAECFNLSGNVIDMGSAHGGNSKTEPHRTYQLTDKAEKAAELAGSEYAQQMFQDAQK